MTEKIRINIVPSFHYDVAYLKTEEEYLHQCIGNIHQALNIMDQYEDYTFHFRAGDTGQRVLEQASRKP